MIIIPILVAKGCKETMLIVAVGRFLVDVFVTTSKTPVVPWTTPFGTKTTPLSSATPFASQHLTTRAETERCLKVRVALALSFS